LDDRDLKLKSLELEHEDVKDVRNTLLTIEWGVPIAIVGAAIQNGWLNSLPNLIMIGFLLYVANRITNDYRANYDKKLKLLRQTIRSLPPRQLMSRRLTAPEARSREPTSYQHRLSQNLLPPLVGDLVSAFHR
jgi:hypothetical protein